MLSNLGDILKIAENGNFAIPAFNVYNMETVMGVIDAARKMHSPVIMQVYNRLFQEENADFLAPIIIAAAQSVNVPICFHLDHGASEKEVIKALRLGCTGIMIDASTLEIESNIKVTKSIVDLCKNVSVQVEGELGHVGLANEDIIEEFTSTKEAKYYVEKSGIFALAILVGNAHGRYKKAPKLDIKRISEIKEVTKTPLVLHGGSGIPKEQIQDAIKAGIRKVNFSTDLCYSFLDKVFETPRNTPAIDIFMQEAIKSVSDFVKEKIELLGSSGTV